MIGFDADHGLVKFNVFELTKLLVRGYFSELHEKFANYPKRIRYRDFDIQFRYFINGAVWDISRGTVLKLAEARTIT